ncbi:MAG TPA: hypothetical protein VN903_03050 [Polyangia bacterium]|nr:hypothetical protein [Polyangia bacterium]
MRGTQPASLAGAMNRRGAFGGCLLVSLCAIAAVGCGTSASSNDASGGAGAGGGAAGHGGTTGAAGSTGAGGSAGTTGGGGSTGSGGATGAGGGAACGSVRCGANQVCAHPSCGGGVAVCIPLGDGGQCPDNWIKTDLCNAPAGAGPGCAPPPCNPPTPSCVDIPSACGGTPTCGCLPANICNLPNGQFGGTCAAVSAGQVLCLSAAANTTTGR